jgi:hypothetical protein
MINHPIHEQNIYDKIIILLFLDYYILTIPATTQPKQPRNLPTNPNSKSQHQGWDPHLTGTTGTMVIPNLVS